MNCCSLEKISGDSGSVTSNTFQLPCIFDRYIRAQIGYRDPDFKLESVAPVPHLHV